MTQEEEIQKCKDDPAYFYNTYTTQGQKIPLTDYQVQLYNKIMSMKGTSFIFLRGRQCNYTGQLVKALEKLDNSLTD